MKNYILFAFLIFSLFLSAQDSNEKILYIVDSIPVIEDPKEGFGILTENDIESVEVTKDINRIQKIGLKKIDGIIYIITKEYSKRPDSIRQIPSTKIMEKRNGVWYYKNNQPYTGKFIDYYLNGKKEGEGYLFNGKLKGKRLMFSLDGYITDEVFYENGLPNGLEKRFYKNGNLMQLGEFKNGKEVGIWEMYHPNGKLKQRTNFNNGKMDGESISFYSTGEVKGKYFYKNGIFQNDRNNQKIFDLYNQSQELFNQFDIKGAIKKLDAALKINPNWADGYFARGTMKLNNFEFDEAKKDFDITLQIEPYFINAYGNRACTIIRKYEFSNSRELSTSKEVKVFVSKKDFVIPDNDIEIICNDLNIAIELGDTNSLVVEAHAKYCKEK
ncbi:toxin-antitoxin system YwqK family antitoxin [Flavobacterium tibetense]|uniref:Uncharacterized protein n=1 Tax=Flavobacterium tibetense TaxID=2233533 RepID=A0A365P004_9FLAO|nr:toxin-antitoxin system YwqK family antitoxin [Flavobacterium tibetense]RBA27817.1 hypothetical protein DPN68_10015 [Flavobacterium tibetense]